MDRGRADHGPQFLAHEKLAEKLGITLITSKIGTVFIIPGVRKKMICTRMTYATVLNKRKEMLMTDGKSDYGLAVALLSLGLLHVLERLSPREPTSRV